MGTADWGDNVTDDDSERTPPLVGVLIGPERIEEGLRMASALPLAENEVEVVLLGAALGDNAEIATHLDSLELEEVAVLAVFRDPRVETLSWQELKERIAGYDHVLSF